jgi:hypothetical protein
MGLILAIPVRAPSPGLIFALAPARAHFGTPKPHSGAIADFRARPSRGSFLRVRARPGKGLIFTGPHFRFGPGMGLILPLLGVLIFALGSAWGSI